MLAPWKKSYDQFREHIEKQRHYFADKCPSSQSSGFSSSHVWMWELDYKESWAPKNQCFWTVSLERALESPLDCKEIRPVHPKGNQPWIFIGRTDADAETPILWSPNAKYWLIGKALDAEKDWRQEEKRATEDEVIGWHHRLNGHEFEQALGVGDAQGRLARFSSWACKESDTTEWMNWNQFQWMPQASCFHLAEPRDHLHSSDLKLHRFNVCDKLICRDFDDLAISQIIKFVPLTDDWQKDLIRMQKKLL